ncbi:hypothetical protein L7F22_008087 [Adiantum nelumboides]|nr:hypothetical protein [Adiantum nelumboides]
MQDSLCGSMNMGVSAVPTSPHCSFSKDLIILDAPTSPLHEPLSLSIMDAACCNNLAKTTDQSSTSSSSNRDLQAATPDSPNLSSSWLSDMIDELIEPFLYESPMLFSPSHEYSSSQGTLTPPYSSISDGFTHDRQDYSGSPTFNAPSTSAFAEDGIYESLNSLHHFPESGQFPSKYMQSDSGYLKRQVQMHPSKHQEHHLHNQHRKPNGIVDDTNSQHKHEHKSRFSLQHGRTMMQTTKLLPNIVQPSAALQKASSAPQLSKLDYAIMSPRRSYSPCELSVAPGQSSKTLKKSNLLQMSQSEYGGFFRRSSSTLVGSGNTSPLYPPDSPPSCLPNSLPSHLGYLSHRLGGSRSASPLHPSHQQGGQPASTLHRNASLQASTSIVSSRQQMRESMAPLQQTSKLPMVHLSEMQRQDSGLRLVHLLLACAEAVAKENYFEAKEIWLHLKQVVSKQGDSMQRVAAYFTDALHARLTRSGGRSYVALRTTFDSGSANEVLAAYQILYQACPYVKFAHFTSNQAIFEAFAGEKRVHIVDLDIIQGYQWPAFIQALAARPGGAPCLRITGVGMPLEAVQETGKQLSELAESLRVPFKFHSVGERLENLKSHMLQRRIGEALAVNSCDRLHRLLSEPMSPLFGVLHMLREQAPSIFTLVEQEASHNGPFFLGRFLEALHYYSAIFDSLDATLPKTSPERAKVEQLVFANEITNIVACEGGERVERHEKLDKWRQMMEAMGFENVALSANAVNQSKLLLGLYPCDGYTLVEDRGSLLLGWQERPIVAASAWRCIS